MHAGRHRRRVGRQSVLQSAAARHAPAGSGTTTLAANHVALFSQLGYALGLLFIIPLADLFSRRRIVLVNFLLLAVSLLAIATASDIRVIHGFSLVTGVCSVIPQIFIPLAAQYSRPEYKNRNVGIVLSGLLTGILASRVVSGVVGELFGWREMYFAAAGLMVVSAAVVLYVLPDARPNFRGTYAALMKSLLTIVRRYPTLRLYSVRAALAFGSFLCFWASLAFKMAQAPFYAGSNVVGMLGLCGIAGALTATFAGKYIRRVGVRRFNYIGVGLQILAWLLFFFGADSYAALVARNRRCRYRHAVHPAQQSGHSVRTRSLGFEPDQHDFYEHLLRGRFARHAAVGSRMVALRLDGSRRGGNPAFVRLAARHALYEKIAVCSACARCLPAAVFPGNSVSFEDTAIPATHAGCGDLSEVRGCFLLPASRLSGGKLCRSRPAGRLRPIRPPRSIRPF